MSASEADLRAFGGQIARLLMGDTLTREEVFAAYGTILKNEQPDLQQGAFMAALHAKKPPTPPELAGVWQAFIEHDVAHQPVNTPEPFVEICGTGADSLKTLNISSGAAIIAAAAGAYVLKKGAPAITGKSGTSDAYDSLGVESLAPLPRAVASLEATGLGFAHAFLVCPNALGRILSQIRFPSSINIIGPLINGFKTKRQVYGVFIPQLTELIAAIAKEIGFDRILVPCGGSTEFEGQYLDEYSNIGPTYVSELRDGQISTYTLTPAQLGIQEYKYADIATGPDADSNARKIAHVLTGRDTGANHDVLCLNAASVLYLADKAPDLASGFVKAKEAVASGAAFDKLKALIQHQNTDPQAGMGKLERLLQG